MAHQKMTDRTKYTDRDDLGLFCTFIESVTVTFNPTRTIAFDIIKPFDLSETTLRYNKGKLTFKNIIQCNIEFINQRYEYPEFYRSAILDNSDLLIKTTEKARLGKGGYKDYYIYIDHGNSQDEYHIVCETHELALADNPKLLADFDGFKE